MSRKEGINSGHDEGIWEISRAKFPPLLKEIPDSPARLFVRGQLPGCGFDPGRDLGQEFHSGQKPDTDRKWLCVVGSRRTSQYGADACRHLIHGLKGQNIVIVSGLAIGIDAIAHQAALEAGLPTVAVVSSGLNFESIYPQSNLRLAQEILAAGGAIVSEFRTDYRPHKFNFPQRNRIMAGLSHATLIVEATLKSGTLITARLALEYNRDVCVVPGSIFSSHTEGPHVLMADGAVPMRTSEDILSVLNIESNTASQVEKVLTDCTGLEKKIYDLLAEPMARTEIPKRIEANAQEISVAISLLEMKGFIVDAGGCLRQKF